MLPAYELAQDTKRRCTKKLMTPETKINFKCRLVVDCSCDRHISFCLSMLIADRLSLPELTILLPRCYFGSNLPNCVRNFFGFICENPCQVLLVLLGLMSVRPIYFFCVLRQHQCQQKKLQPNRGVLGMPQWANNIRFNRV